MNNNETAFREFKEFANTTEVLRGHLSSCDEDRAHEAISVMLMPGMDFFGPESAAMRQFFPLWDAIRAQIDNSQLEPALSQTVTWEQQLAEVIGMVENG